MCLALICMMMCTLSLRAEEMLPKHVTPAALKAVRTGLDYLAKTQTSDGNWSNTPDTANYPVSMAALGGMAFLANGNTTTRGPYADNVKLVIEYLLSNVRPSGIITGPTEEYGRPMYGHGFSLMFLATAYGMETDARRRDQMKKAIEGAIKLTATGQSSYGGWTYRPGDGDEGSVTVTQLQGLRAASNAGFTVPKQTIEEAIRYLERCRTPEGGIVYSLGSGGGARPAISAGALAGMYNAGEYNSDMAEKCLEYVAKQFMPQNGNFNNSGHDYYAHFYAAQAFYQAGDEYFDKFFPSLRDMFIKTQNKAEGSWTGDGIGPVYGTAVACITLQLPYKFLPIYQR